MIEFKDVLINQYNLSFYIDESKNTLITSNNEDILKKMFQDLSGNQKNTNIKYLREDIYKNKEYFDFKISLNDSLYYFKSLNERKVSSLLLSKYQKALNDKKYKALVHDLCVRFYQKTGVFRNNLSNKGKLLNVFALALSMYYYRIINISSNNYKELNKDDFININNALNEVKTNYGCLLLSENYQELLDNIDIVYVLSNNNVFKIDVKEDKVLVLSPKDARYNLNIPDMIKKNILYYGKTNDNLILCENNTKEELSLISKYYKIQEKTLKEALLEL